MATILEEYRQKHARSLELYEQARPMMPDGVTHDVRYLTPFPVYMDRAAGPRKWDVDGNEYVGYVMGHGALILGHCHRGLVEEVNRQVRRGTHLGFNTTLEIRWAEAVKALLPSVEKIRFHSSGTEATLMAFRLARAYTGRSRILKFVNHFHGWQDYAVVAAGQYSSAGVPEKTVETVRLLEGGRIEEVEALLSQDRDIAAVILEPTGAKGGALPLPPQFLKDLREVTEKHGVVLIFDEVVTGFRVGPGGAQERFGVRPDLTTMAKVFAGGMPGGAVGGKAAIMDMIAHRGEEPWDHEQRIAHPGTFNANPVSAAAGSRCLEIIAAEPITQRAEEAGSRLKRRLNEIIAARGVKAFAHGYGSLIFVVWGVDYHGDLEVCTAPHAALLDSINSETTQMFRRGMLNHGVDVMGGHQFILSAVHGEREIEDTAAAFEKTLDQLEAEGAVQKR